MSNLVKTNQEALSSFLGFFSSLLLPELILKLIEPLDFTIEIV